MFCTISYLSVIKMNKNFTKKEFFLHFLSSDSGSTTLTYILLAPDSLSAWNGG
jgi:hypothetical protein